MVYDNIQPAERARLFVGAVRVLGLDREPQTVDEALRLARAELLAFHDLDEVPELMRIARGLEEQIAEYVDPDRRARVCAVALAAAVGCPARGRIVAHLAGMVRQSSRFGRVWWVEADSDDAQTVNVPFERMAWDPRSNAFTVKQ